MGVDGLIKDRYRLLGRPDPSGERWLARDEWSGMVVVATLVTVGPPGSGAEADRVHHAVAREVRALSAVRNPHLLRPLDVVLDAGRLWVISERGPGPTLAAVLAQRGRVGPWEAASWGRDIADALAAALAAGVLHHDLHAGVVELGADGTAVVGGFAATQPGCPDRSPVHAAPELAQRMPASPASAVYALGAILHVAVEGTPPWHAETGLVACPQRAGELTDLLQHALHPDPAVRPGIAQVRDHLVRMVSRSTQQARHRRAPAVAAVLAVAVLAGGVALAATTPWTDPGRPVEAVGRPAPTGTPAPVSPIGDPRTVDPCALLDAESVAGFGSAAEYPDVGPLASCMVDVRPAGAGYVLLFAKFGTPEVGPLPGAVERSGDLQISREPAEDGACYRTIELADGHRVYLSAFLYDGAVMDPCAVADAGTATAVLALAGGDLPDRTTPEPPNSLRQVQACSLLRAADVAQVPGIDPSRRAPGFAGWECTWGDDPAFLSSPYAAVWMRRVVPLSGEPTPIGGRPALVTPGGFAEQPGTCVVEVVHRSYTGESGEPRVEEVVVEVGLGESRPSEQACEAATALAAALVPRLPPGS
ncbi:MAG: hypothetical protein ABR608_05730 [Pseudonocardiaceae bacterium]